MLNGWMPGADPQIADGHGHTALEEAEYWGHSEVVQYLRGLGVTMDSLAALVEGGDIRGVKRHLLRGNSLMDEPEGPQLLHRAARKGDLAMLRLLLSVGLDPTTPDDEGHIPAEVALMHGHMRVSSGGSSGPGGVVLRHHNCLAFV